MLCPNGTGLFLTVVHLLWCVYVLPIWLNGTFLLNGLNFPGQKSKLKLLCWYKVHHRVKDTDANATGFQGMHTDPFCLDWISISALVVMLNSSTRTVPPTETANLTIYWLPSLPFRGNQNYLWSDLKIQSPQGLWLQGHHNSFTTRKHPMPVSF